MIARLSWWTGLAVLAVAAAGFQVDRQARRDRVLAPLVPAPFRNFSQEALVRRDLDQGNAPHTLNDAKLLIARRPVPDDSLALLGLAALQAGNDDLARNAIALAAGRGWRSPVPQLVVAASAFDLGEWDVVGDRLSALWKTDSLDDRSYALTVSVLGEPRARAHFASRIAENEPATRRFVDWASTGLAPPILRDVLARLTANRSSFDCGLMSKRAAEFAQAGQVSAAQALWDVPCANGKGGDPASLAFTPVRGGPPGPFDWGYPDEPSVQTEISRGPEGGYLLSFDNSNPLMTPLATKVVQIARGSHTVTWQQVGKGQPGAVPAALYLRMQCIGSGTRNPYSATATLAGGAAVQIPEKGCNAQRITVLGTHGTGPAGWLSLH